MKLLKPRLKKKMNSQSGQGMTEYILLIVVVIAVAGAFRKPIMDAVTNKMTKVGGQIEGFE